MIKDLVLTRGIRTTFGSRLYADYVPAEDDIAVARLKAAGAIVIGKGNAAELGYGGFGHNPLFPTTRNPWDLALTPGGSSAGSAAAVAAGIVPMALGSDGGGSVRLPAAFTGIVGMKPTMGRIPVWPGCRDETLPGVSGWESIEHYGPLTRTVADAALFLAATVGPDRRDRWSLPDEVGDWASVPPVPGGSPRRLLPDLGGRAGRAGGRGRGRGGGAALRHRPRRGGRPRPRRRSGISRTPTAPSSPWRPTSPASAVSLPAASTIFRRGSAACSRAAGPPSSSPTRSPRGKRAVNAMARFMARYDLILTPTAPLAAFADRPRRPRHHRRHRPVADDAWSPCLYPANLTGQPAISVPAGFTRSGLPVGLQIIGDRLADRLVLAAAAAFEAAQPWTDSRPPYFA